MDDRGTAVVIEDDDDIRELVAMLLTQSGFEVKQAPTGQDGVRLVAEYAPVVVTVDLGLPDIDGLEVTRRVRGMTDAYVLMLTARVDEIDTLMGLEAGADDYITKPFRPRELRARIDALLRRPRSSNQVAVVGAGKQPEPQPGAPVLVGVGGNDGGGTDHRAKRSRSLFLDGLSVDPDLYEVTADGCAVQLTPTEFTLLRSLLAAGRVVRSKVELFRILRGEEPMGGTYVSDADERTVEVHMGNLRRKLGDDPRDPRWIETVRGVGYRAAGIPERHEPG